MWGFIFKFGLKSTTQQALVGLRARALSLSLAHVFLLEILHVSSGQTPLGQLALGAAEAPTAGQLFSPGKLASAYKRAPGRLDYARSL